MSKVFLNPLILFSCFVFLFGTLEAGNLPSSRQTSVYTYIYSLTNEEAEAFFKRDSPDIEPSVFHALVDSFKTGELYSGKLKPGHYLQTYAHKGEQKVLFTSVPDFDVFILNNNTDLSLQVYDLLGNPITNADLSIKNRWIKFDKTTQTYLDKKSNLRGLLKVSYNGFTSWYRLERQQNNSALRRNSRRLLYRTPLKYAWIPVVSVVNLPVDGARSAIKGQTVGVIYSIKRFFRNLYFRVACLFDDYQCDRFSGRQFRDKFTGYMVFNKPKYMPGDTVKFKAFIIDKKGRPVKDDVNVVMPVLRKNVVLTRLSPYRRGAYAWEFVLHDSLEMRLDRTYTVFLERSEDKEYISGRFKYEDYELTKNKLSLRVETSDHYRGNHFVVYVKGTDENDLNLPDARVEILAKPAMVNQYFNDQVFVPDTLFYHRQKLEPAGETEVIVSDSAFPAVNMDYELQVRMLTSDNESVSEMQPVTYYFKRQNLDVSLTTDSVMVCYEEDGEPQKKQVSLLAVDNFGNRRELVKGVTPLGIKADPFVTVYLAKTDSLEKQLDLSAESSLLQCFSERDKDSIRVVVDNPRQIPFVYNIYKRNSAKVSGYSDTLQYNQAVTTKQNFFISLRYIWGGKVEEDTYRVPYSDKQLKVAVLQPRIVYPGQKSQMQVRVTDAEGRPVEGVDLTAFGLTRKFGYTPPSLPSLEKSRKNKEVINNFSFSEGVETPSQSVSLDYETWKVLAGLDSIEYYRFLYPGNSIYRFESTAEDSITQFAPFVIKSGSVQPVHIVYVDNRPVYFGWSTNYQPYSFPVESGHHQLKLRTQHHEIQIDSVWFNPGQKLVLSLNTDLMQKGVTVKKVTAVLSSLERNRLYPYIFPFRNKFESQYACVEQADGRIQLLNRQNRNYFQGNIAGPVSGPLTFHLLDSFSTRFVHEPFFEYEFSPGLLKMRQVDKERFPANLYYPLTEQPLGDQVITASNLLKQWQDYKDSRRYMTARYRNPYVTPPGAGKLLFEFEQERQSGKELPLNLLVLRYDKSDFLRIYPGQVRTVHDLEKGFYRLIFFYPGARYHSVDSLMVKDNGVSFLRLDSSFELKKDTFSTYVSQLIEDQIFKQQSHYPDEDIKKIRRSYQQNFQYTGMGDVVDGYVVDSNGDPIPGATIVARGTTYGTITDIDGYYSLKVPPGYNWLDVSFIGFVPEEIMAVPGQRNNLVLSEDVLAMDEVIVVGYGVQKKYSLTGSIVTVNSKSVLGEIAGAPSDLSAALQGRVAGVEISSDSGGYVSIRIRGQGTTQLNGDPIYIINGMVYEGDISKIDAKKIKGINILKGVEATALYGARAVNGVVIIDMKDDGFLQPSKSKAMGADYDAAFLEAASQASSIRNNFSDYAFWQPRLTTDKEGKAAFDVTFPDDVTSWETFVLAMNGDRQSGQWSGLIKSYKPLMAQLVVPRFLIEGDSTVAIGKTLNYTDDSVNVTTKFEKDGVLLSEKTRICSVALIDSLSVVASHDSLSLKYMLEKEDGYMDGEVRDVAVFRKGLEETTGNFYVLDQDTVINLEPGALPSPVKLFARADQLDIVTDEISRLVDYRYNCNEQVASKLKALLAEKQIAEHQGKRFDNDSKAQRLIRLLTRNRKDNGWWGWWKDSPDNSWATLHVLEALARAKQMGYSLKLDSDNLAGKITWDLENTTDITTRIRLMKMARIMGITIDYKRIVAFMEAGKQLTSFEMIQLMELRQLFGMACNTDSLKYFRRETLFGNVFYSFPAGSNSLVNNDVQSTLMVYNILKNDSVTDPDELQKMRNYLFEQRKSGSWRNTWESARVIETILPDILTGKRSVVKPELRLSGDIVKEVTTFPFEMELQPGQNISVEKTGDAPVYLTTWQHYWNPAPQVRRNDFEITTRFQNEPDGLLTGGKVTKLIATVKINKAAEFVMINIPIPAGCSYANKEMNRYNEAHREYYRNEVAIFCERLSVGEHTFEVELLPRYPGKYTINPARVELMYFPTFYSNNGLKNARIK